MQCFPVSLDSNSSSTVLTHISTALQAAEVVGLCDYNPHGLALLLTYRFPSAASLFEGEGLQVPMR